MKRSDAFPSKYLSKEDVPNPVTVTVQGVELETLNGENGEETKPVMSFAESVKPMIVNNANWSAMEAMYGDDSDGWVGKSVTVFVDPTVMFGKKRVGGLRIQYSVAAVTTNKPNGNGTKPQAAPAPAPATATSQTLTIAKGFDIEAFRAKVAKQYPYYADKNGKPNTYHIIKALVKVGIYYLGDDNAEEAFAMLGYHVQAEEEAKQAA